MKLIQFPKRTIKHQTFRLIKKILARLIIKFMKRRKSIVEDDGEYPPPFVRRPRDE